MNRLHHWICSSNRWKRILAKEVLPRVLNGVNLGANVLEVGPGPGLATELLRKRCEHLTCLEIDPVFALPLRDRMKHTNVIVVEGDGANMQFPDGAFTSAVSLTMLHHVPSPALQDRLFAEVRRVLQPGGVFVGMDVRDALSLRIMHWGDTYVPIDPDNLASRFKRAGFEDVSIMTEKRAFSFFAKRTA